MNDNVRIEGTILRTASWFWIGAAFPREGKAGESTLDLHVSDVTTGLAGDVKSDCS